MFKSNYGAIIKSIELNNICSEIVKLEKQKYPPKSYFIAILKVPNNEDLTKFQNYIQSTGKLWKLKVASEELDLNYLIDEFFVTKSINTMACLFINGEIAEDLSEDIKIAVDQFKECWYFKINQHIYFYSILCDHFEFNKLEDMLIAKGHKNKIYGELFDKEYSPRS